MSKKGWWLLGGAGCLVVFLGVVGAGMGLGYLVSQSPQLQPPSGRASDYEPATAAEAEAFGALLESMLHTSPELASPLFDADETARRALPDGLTYVEEQQLLAAFREGLVESTLTQIQSELAGGGAYDFRGVAERDGFVVARFRMLLATQGIAFHDYIVARNGAGDVRAIDIHLMVTGEYLSQTLAAAVDAVRAAEPGFVERIQGEQNVRTQDLPKLEEMRAALDRGDPHGALRAYDAMSETSRRDRLVMLLRVQAAGLLDEATYLSAIEDLRVTFPDDPAANIQLLDAYYMRQEWTKLLQVTDAMDRAYPDPYWDVMRARAHHGAGEFEQARAAVDRAVAAEPDLLDVQDALLLVALAQGDQETAQATLMTLVLQFDIDPVLLAEQPGYEGVRALPGYRR